MHKRTLPVDLAGGPSTDKLSGGLLISVVVLGGLGYWLGNRQ
jgi:hypothetical protein